MELLSSESQGGFVMGKVQPLHVSDMCKSWASHEFDNEHLGNMFMVNGEEVGSLSN